MSNANLLTWDNMEEVIDSLPKDANGRFLPNPNPYKKEELVLSTERDTWVEEPLDLLSPIVEARKKLVTNPVDIILGATEALTGFAANDLKNKIIDVLVDDGFLYDKERWCKESTFDYVNDLLVLKTKDGVLAEIREEPTSAPNESVIKLNYTKLYAVCHVQEPKPVVEKESVGMGNYYSEDLSADTEVIHMRFGDGKGIAQMGAALIASGLHGRGDHEAATMVEKTFHLTSNLSDEEKDKLYPKMNEVGGEALNEGVQLLSAINERKTSPAKTIDLDKAELENDPLLRAQQGLANLDTSEAEAELAQQAESIERTKQLKESGLLEIANSPMTNPNMTPAELKAWTEANVAKAKASIIGVDKLITYAGRLNVKDKFLMNCPADLNQLIPFKYNWAWSFYLTSSSNHWMPGELSLYRIAEEWKTVNSGIKKLVARAWYTHNAKLGLFGEGVLVNLYRQITNPESRQYLLRQGQEFIVVRHAWMEINECLNVKDTLIDGLTPATSLKSDNDIFNQRTLLTRKHVQHLRDLTSTTETAEKLAEFLKAFIIGYTCTNWLTPLVSYYQVITALEFNETCQPLAYMFMNLIRDNISQFEFAKLFIAGVLEENPHLFNDKWRDDILVAINDLIEFELALTGTLAAGENDTADIKYICNHYKDEMMSIIDPSYQKVFSVGDNTRGQEFIHVINTLTPAVDHNAGLGAVQW